MNYLSSYILTIFLVIALIIGCYFFTDAIKISLIIFSILFVLIILPEILETRKELKRQEKEAHLKKLYDQENDQ